MIDTYNSSDEQAGLFVTIGLLGLAIGSMAASAYVNRVSRRGLAITAGVIGAASYLIMMIHMTSSALTGFELIAGLASGVVLATSGAVGGTSHDPGQDGDRLRPDSGDSRLETASHQAFP